MAGSATAERRMRAGSRCERVKAVVVVVADYIVDGYLRGRLLEPEN
jgi:hypothetical protein